jgi:hypothetical protein
MAKAQRRDPLARRQDAREAATVRELIDTCLKEHASKLSNRNAADPTSMLRKLVEPEWGRKAVEIATAVDRLLANVAARRDPARTISSARNLKISPVSIWP